MMVSQIAAADKIRLQKSSIAGQAAPHSSCGQEHVRKKLNTLWNNEPGNRKIL